MILLQTNVCLHALYLLFMSDVIQNPNVSTNSGKTSKRGILPRTKVSHKGFPVFYTER
jgi:hypothetical protein